ncbi:hypothetical protein F4804DRAFT_304522 [Jackrogersella minutella]|nr:hypothetical protein F4804DRAFT_304522 [Jackrogersella minutella]
MECQSCPAVTVLQWKSGSDSWEHNWPSTNKLQEDVVYKCEEVFPQEAQICLTLANATKIRACHNCRSSLTEVFKIPEIWWSDFCQNSNGCLGSEVTRHEGTITGFNTWASFEIKQLDAAMQYEWYKVTVFIRWVVATNQTIILAFDTKSPVAEYILDALQHPDLSHINDPFWVYARLASNVVVRFQDTAVWAIRNQVRAIETEKKPMGRPYPDYRRLHDIARHAIHVSETLDVATDTMEGILAQHENFLNKDVVFMSRPSMNQTHDRLTFSKNVIGNLRHRAASNRKRLQNEIQLAYNTVSQYDSEVSVRIGRAAQTDSAAMKTVAFLTMTFLPATFLSAIFSMSFFNYSADIDSWNVSNKLWIYWAFAIPTTLGTFTLWHFWHKIFPPDLIE